MGVDAVNLYRSGGSVALSTTTWEPAQVDSTRHIDTDWTADTATNYSIAQDAVGTVVLVGTVNIDSASSYKAGSARLEVDTGSGFGAIAGATVATWHDGGTNPHTPSMFAAISGAAGDEYRLAGYEPDSGNVLSITASSSLCGFYAPDDVCYAIGGANDNGSTSFAAVSITGTGGLVEGSFSVASNAVTLPSDGDYLIFYRASCARSGVLGSSDEDWAIRLAEDTGGGYAAIAGTELHQHTGYYSGTGHTIGGCLIHSGSTGDKIQLQFQTDGSDCDIDADGVALLICKLPAGWEGFSGYEASAATPGTSLGAVDLDTEWAKSGLTHDTGTNPERVTLPAETTTCLVVSVFTGADTSGTGNAESAIYRDLTGTPADMGSTSGYASGYSPGTKHTTWNAVVDSFSASDVLGLYGKVSASAAGVAHSHLTILRLDNLGAAASGNLAGTIAGTGTASGTIAGTGALAGTSDGAATVTGTLVQPSAALVGTSEGTSTATGTLAGTGALAGTSDGAATATGTLAAPGSVVGTSDGAATVTGTLAGTGALVGSEAGAATVTGTLAATGAATGAAAGAATATGTLAGSAALTGATAGTSTATATVAGKGSMVGAVAGAATATGTLAALVYADGSAAGAATATGTLAAWAYLDGTGAGVGSGVGVLYGSGALLGASAGAATATGICLAASSSIYDAGSVSLDRSPSGTVSADRSPSGAVSASRTLTGTVERY